MQGDEARMLLGFPPNSRPSSAQVKEAYIKKVWESHPDRFPVNEKPQAESKFKLVSEAYTILVNGANRDGSASAYTRVVRRGVPTGSGGRRNQNLIKIPFLFIILGTLGLGGSNAARAYKREKEKYPSHNPFLP